MNRFKLLILYSSIFSINYAFNLPVPVFSQENVDSVSLESNLQNAGANSDSLPVQIKTEAAAMDSGALENLPSTQNLESNIAAPLENDLTPLPEIRSEGKKLNILPPGPPFFEIQNNIEQLREKMDSLEKIVELYKTRGGMTTVNEELLNLIRIPEFQHRVQLRNGTTVIGEILERSDLRILIQTSIGQLSIDMDKVELISDVLPPQALVELIGDPAVNIYPDREEIQGRVKNVGEKRADFVRIIASLWSADTNLAASDSVFINGSKKKYNTGIVSDTMLKPGSMGIFKIVIPVPEERKVEYRTYEVRWEETD
ncbi:MAG: hypothetical protein V3S48_05635 [Candidatus Neomarinimicrobiota bacterium]